jgi:hypothetical protein
MDREHTLQASDGVAEFQRSRDLTSKFGLLVLLLCDQYAD